MPRLSRAVPSYRKHRASGQAVVTLGCRDFYLGPYGTQVSRNEYDRLVGEWLTQGRQLGRQHAAPDGSSPALTVTQLTVAYMHFADGYYRKHGERTSEYTATLDALRPVRRLYGRRFVTEFGPLALQTVMQAYVDAGWARSTINKQAGRVKRMFRWGVSQELIPSHLADALAKVDGLRKGRTTARETEPILPVADATVETTMSYLPDVVADMVRLQQLSGMRPAEVCQLRPIDVDRTGDVWKYRPESHKTEHHGRERVVYLGPKAQGILLRYLARDARTYCFRPCDSEAKRRAARHATRMTPIQYGNRPGTKRKASPQHTPGEVYDTNAYRRAIHRACDKAFPHPTLAAFPESKLDAEQLAKLKQWQSEHRWSPNQLRHAAATNIRRDFGLEAAQVMLGHASALVTEIYAETDARRGIEVARQIG
jgi:integrase